MHGSMRIPSNLTLPGFSQTMRQAGFLRDKAERAGRAGTSVHVRPTYIEQLCCEICFEEKEGSAD
jgi:hypothetical protein